MQPTLDEVKKIAYGAGEILRAGFGTQLDIRHKGAVDLVTDVDHRSEDYLVGQIRQAHPDHLIITEESGRLEGNSAHAWHIDPLDGTVNYAHSVPLFGVSVAYAENGQVQLGAVYDPMRDECFYAARGQGAWLNGKRLHVSSAETLVDSLLVTGFPYDRNNPLYNNLGHFSRLTHLSQGVRRLGSAALDMSYVAAGRMDGFWELTISSWDIAAGTLLVEEAGGMVSKFDGNPDMLTPPCSVVAANPTIFPLLIKELHDIRA
jgi:myo-inositol-1(or 4)-monophosphatase